MPDHTIYPLDAARADQAGALLARAFEDDPTYAGIEPDALKRRDALTWLMARVVRHALRRGVALSTSALDGVACWLPPGRADLSLPDMLQAGFLGTPSALGWEATRRLLRYLSYASALHHRHARGRHWYLWVIGVDPLYQGTGIGGRLMARGLEMVDADAAPAYLETGSERNVRFYQRFGFRLAGQGSVPGSGDPVWAMLRPARGDILT